jgi:hypothetical protein
MAWSAERQARYRTDVRETEPKCCGDAQVHETVAALS